MVFGVASGRPLDKGRRVAYDQGVPATSRPSQQRALALVVVFVGAAACGPKKDPRCGDRSVTQCAWEKAVTGDRPVAAPGEEVEGWYDPRTPARTREDEWTRATEILGEAWTLMGEGVEGEAVATQARKWCEGQADADGSTPEPTGPRRESWVCELAEAPRFDGRALRLEVGTDGVVALSVAKLGEGEATRLVAEAADHWAYVCADGAFREFPARGAVGAYQGCTLQDGPVLVLSRFLPEPDAPLWQVSLSVMPAG